MSYTPPPAPATKTIGSVLREWRKSARLAQSTLANALGSDQTTVSLYELDKRRPSAATVGEWARACGRGEGDALPLLRVLAGFDPAERVAA